jgi:hypothetical protein
MPSAYPDADPTLAEYCRLCGTHYRINKGHVCNMSINLDEFEKPGGNRCAEVLTKALELTSGDRAKTHGDKRANHQNIADLWNVYLSGKPAGWAITPQDVAIMMCLLKIARLKSGTFNLDNFIDLAGYAGVAAECSDDQ